MNPGADKLKKNDELVEKVEEFAKEELVEDAIEEAEAFDDGNEFVTAEFEEEFEAKEEFKKEEHANTLNFEDNETHDVLKKLLIF